MDKGSEHVAGSIYKTTKALNLNDNDFVHVRIDVC
jgi:hypothetical protein